MTPAELYLYAIAERERKQAEQANLQINLYNLARLIRVMVWANQPPDYDSVFPSDHHDEEMTDEQMLKLVQSLNARFGGEEVN